MKGSEHHDVRVLGLMQNANKGLDIDLPSDPEIREMWQKAQELTEAAMKKHWDKTNALVHDDDT